MSSTLSTARRTRSGLLASSDAGIAWLILAIALVLSASLILFETRSNTFFNDEAFVFQELGAGIDARSIIEPHNGHLIAPARMIYAAVFSATGPDHTTLRVIGALVFLACCVLFFVLVKRRVGALLALAPTVVLLFFGSSWATLLLPFLAVTSALSVAFGLGALLALERNDGKGDLAACVLLALSVASFSTGLAFIVGVALAVLLGPNRRDRAWIFLVPLLLYAAWRLWALQFPGNPLHATNALLIPSFSVESLAAVGSAVTGLSFNFAQGSAPGLAWGPVVALVAAVAVAVRLWRGSVPPFLWVALATLVAYWAALALAFGPSRTPSQSRYLFPGAVLLLLVAAGAVSGLRLPRGAVIAIFAVAAASVLTNIKQLDDAEQPLRDYAVQARADLGAVELARESVPPDFRPSLVPEIDKFVATHLPLVADPYLAAVDRFGSYAFSADELLAQDPDVRAEADRVLASAEQLSLRPAPGGPATDDCVDVSGGPTSPTVRDLPPGQIRFKATESADVLLGRFAPGYPVALGTLNPGSPVRLTIPRDASSRPWRIAIASEAPMRLCSS